MNDPGHIEGADNSTLMIIGVNATDGGEYSCRVVFVGGNITSDPVSLYGEESYIQLLVLRCMHIATHKGIIRKDFFIITGTSI